MGDLAPRAEDNLGLAEWLVDRYIFANPRLETHRDDLFQEACTGLIFAVRKYNPEKAGFATYAKWWMSAYVRKYIKHATGIFHYPANRASKALPVVDAAAVEATLQDTAPIDPLSAVDVGRCIERLEEIATWSEKHARDVEIYVKYMSAKFDYVPDRDQGGAYQRIRDADGLYVIKTLVAEYGLCHQAIRDCIENIGLEMKAWAEAGVGR